MTYKRKFTLVPYLLSAPTDGVLVSWEICFNNCDPEPISIRIDHGDWRKIEKGIVVKQGSIIEIDKKSKNIGSIFTFEEA